MTTSRSSFARVACALALLCGCGSDPVPPGNDACDYIAEACHGGTGVADECHDLGHDDVLSVCEAQLARCLTACTVDAGVVDDAGAIDAGDPDAGPSDGGPTPDGGPESVTLRFVGRVGTEAFACGESYLMGTPPVMAEPVDFRLYVHDVRMVAADGTEVPLTMIDGDFQRMGVALLDFEDATAACTQGDAETNTEIRGTVPAGDYVGVAFRVGVPFELNHADLTSLPAPLNRTSLFWSWRGGHLFFAGTTRTIPAVGADAGAPNEHFTHLGSTMCVGDPAMGVPVTSCARPNRPSIALDGFDVATDAIVVDLAAVKADVDISADGGCHSFSAPCAFPFDALGLNWSTGSETPSTQTVFRVE